jgi:hypothetical protein
MRANKRLHVRIHRVVTADGDPGAATVRLEASDDHLIRDIRYGLRLLRHAPIFTADAIVSLGL